jgi:hypothetical protein
VDQDSTLPLQWFRLAARAVRSGTAESVVDSRSLNTARTKLFGTSTSTSDPLATARSADRMHRSNAAR